MTETAVPGDSERHPGPNAWLLDEMRSQFEYEPEELDDDSLSFFATAPTNGASPSTTPATAAPAAAAPAAAAPVQAAQAPVAAPPAAAPPTANGAAAPAAPTPTSATPAAAPAPAAATAEVVEPVGKPLRGAAARIVENMEASLTVPTATSFRDIPAKMLEANRRVINGYLRRTRQGQGQLHPT